MPNKYIRPATAALTTLAALALAGLALMAAAPPASLPAPHADSLWSSRALPPPTLYDQTGAPDLINWLGINSQNWPGMVSEVADDFVVPADSPQRFWHIAALVVHHRLSTAITSMRIRFYADVETDPIYLPAPTHIYSGTYPITEQYYTTITNTGVLTIALGTPVVVLTSGRYWVSAQSPLAGDDYKFLWQVNEIGENTAPSAFRGYKEGQPQCLDNWGRRVADCNNGIARRPEDMRFELRGTAGIFTNRFFLPVIRR